ncbi:uncharacterized protein LOC128392614 [Panonychus citri]|uniref:uncharacterized protein LOC128392614 n=1 Tax=Panonychus citri TaxID=50023 RepID=UPI0023074B56|nr:uncharacterized protein LOC128392614 [Panonychus citri]XP_053208636.1 uncharacterized protein LOC128392614 [Panonychus citri]
MPGNGKLDTNAVANRIEKWLNDIRTAIEKHSFQRRIVQPSNGNDDQPVDQDEQSGENIATWLTDERMTITMGQVKREFSGLTSDNLDPVIKSDIEELVRKMTSYELVTICQKIDFCIVKSGLAETGIFLYELIHKLGLQDTTITEPKTRVMISTLIGSLHRSIGPTTPLHILVHFMGDLDETLEKVKKNPRDSSLKLDNMISLSCYLVASKSCSTKFLETILTKIGHCSEEKIKKNLNRVLQLTNCVLDKPNQLRIEKVLAPYRSKIECDQIKPSSSKSSKSKK